MKEAKLIINGETFEIKCDRPTLMLVEEPAYINGLSISDTYWSPINIFGSNIESKCDECLLIISNDNFTLCDVIIENNIITFKKAILNK
jgi:hypothetical protein